MTQSLFKINFYAQLYSFIIGHFPWVSNYTPEELNCYFSTDIFSVESTDNNISNSTPSQQMDLITLATNWNYCQQDSEKKSSGIIYTPKEIAEYILKDKINEEKNSILDPACGSGIFLILALQKLLEKHNVNADFEDYSNLLTECIFGIDKDLDSIKICRLLLQCQILLAWNVHLNYIPTRAPSIPNLSHNIIYGDSLLSKEDAPKLETSLNWQEAFPHLNNGFDIIVGNPPYGLKRDGQLTDYENKCLLKKYSPSRHGKINKYLAFMAQCYNHLNKQGIMSFIVPNAWLGIDAGKALREQFLKNQSITKIVSFSAPVFKKVNVECVIFELNKANKIEHINIFHASSNTNIPNKPAFSISHQNCLNNFNGCIPIYWHKHSDKILNYVQKCRKLQDCGFSVSIALQAYAKGKGQPPQTENDVKKHIFHAKSKLTPDYYPYLTGSDLKRYQITWSGEFLKYGFHLAEQQPLHRYTSPRLIIREILAPLPYAITASYTEKDYIYNRSILHIFHQNKESLLALLAILNSQLASEIISLFGKKSQRHTFPKLVAADLKNFPLPNDFFKYQTELAALVREKLNCPNLANDQIDNLVQKCYEE